MTTLATYAAFLTARWDEIEAAAAQVDPAAWGYDVTTNREVWADNDRVSVGVGYLRDDLAAKRAILERIGFLFDEPDGLGNLVEDVLELLAEPFRSHPDHPAAHGR